MTDPDEPNPLGQTAIRVVKVQRPNGDIWPAITFTTFVNEYTFAIPVEQATQVADLISEGLNNAATEARTANSGIILSQ